MPFYYRCDSCLEEQEVGKMDWSLEESCEDCAFSACTKICIVNGRCSDCWDKMELANDTFVLDNEDDGA